MAFSCYHCSASAHQLFPPFWPVAWLPWTRTRVYAQLGLGTLQDGSLPKPSWPLPEWASRKQLVHCNSVLVKFLELRLRYMPSIRYSNERRQRLFCWWTPAMRLTPLTISLPYITSVDCVYHLLQPSSLLQGTNQIICWGWCAILQWRYIPLLLCPCMHLLLDESKHVSKSSEIGCFVQSTFGWFCVCLQIIQKWKFCMIHFWMIMHLPKLDVLYDPILDESEVIQNWMFCTIHFWMILSVPANHPKVEVCIIHFGWFWACL